MVVLVLINLIHSIIPGDKTEAKMNISLSRSARQFMDRKGIDNVTFDLKDMDPAGAEFGIQEIEPVYKAPEDASLYRYFQVEGKHIFISRDIKVVGPLEVTTEGFWKMKRLTLKGASIHL